MDEFSTDTELSNCISIVLQINIDTLPWEAEREALSYTIVQPTHTVPFFEEAAKAEGDEFKYWFQHESRGEEIVAVLQGEI